MSLPSSPRSVVTGAAGGLGRAICLALAERGAKILVADRDLAGAEETVRLVAARGGTAHAVACDVSRPHDVESLVGKADALLGGVDLLVNNAGVAVAGPVGEVALADWEWIVGINLWGVIYGCHFFLPRMKKQGSGHVLNVASAAGLISAPEMAPYNVTKSAVVALSETLAGELAGSGVGVTVLCPTFFQTNIAASARRSGAAQDMEEIIRQRMAGASIQADGVARAALQGCDRGELYVVPMRDGRWMWRLQRLSPGRYYATMPKLMAAMRKRATKAPA